MRVRETRGWLASSTLTPAQVIRLALVGGGLGYLVVRYLYLPDRVAAVAEAGDALRWESIASSTAAAVLIGAILFAGLCDMAGMLVRSVRFLRSRKQREQDFLINLGDTKKNP